MEKTKENNIPNLINSDGSTLLDKENQKRGEILTDMKEKREQRDSLIKKSRSITTKINDFFGKGEGASLQSRIWQIEHEVYRDTESQHQILNRDLKRQAKQILTNTIKDPLAAITELYRKKENQKQKSAEYSDLDSKLEEQKILDTIKCENIATAFSNKELRKEVTFNLRNFFDSQHNWQVYQNIERVDGYSNKEAKGLPVEVAKAVLEGLQQSIEQDGVLNIEDDPKLFLLLNEVIYVYPDGLTDTVKDSIASLMLERGSGLEMHTLARLPRLMELVESTKYHTEYNSRIDKRFTDLFDQKKWFDIDCACRSYGEGISTMALKKLDEYLKQYRITLDDVRQAWELYPGMGESGFRNLEANMEKIERLEVERPGITKTLLFDFHIKEFRRYSNEVLIEQFDTRKMDIPYGIVLFTNKDHNQAFDTDTETIKSLFEQSKKNNIGLRVMEFDSSYELMKDLAELNARYGAEHKISYVLLGAHGQEDSFQTTYTQNVHKNDFDEKGVQKIKDFFVEQPEIILASCSTGAENGIGQKISEMYDATVYAPDKPTNVSSIDMKVEEGKPTFSVRYRDDVLQSYTSGVQKQ